MKAKQIILIGFLLLLCTQIPGPRPATGALPAHYQEKRVFYDSLSIVINKYIVPVNNWSLLTGTLEGLQDQLGRENFQLKAVEGRLVVMVPGTPTIGFRREAVETDAIQLVESVSQVFDLVFARFEEADKTKIIHAAVRGMVATLEPNSYFIDPEDLTRLRSMNRGIFEGIGLEITTRDRMVTVVSPYEDTPAFRQGLLPGDRILAVDQVPTKDLPITEVSSRIRGETGEPVRLTIHRPGWAAPRDITLVREIISHRTVKARDLEAGFGYIRIINFLGSTDDDFAAALARLEAEAPLKGLILDLRYNPGGLLNQALGLVDFFLAGGVITSTDGRIKSDNKTYYARPATLQTDCPIVILVNGGSASSSEIVAAALRSHQRAVLVGERTFGKGYIQTVFPIRTGGAIRLTTSMLLTPEGDRIQDHGLEPDLYFQAGQPEVGKPEAPAGNKSALPAPGAAPDDPAVQLGLDILKRSILLQQVAETELEGLSPEQIVIRKRFQGLNRALAEVAGERQLRVYRRPAPEPEQNPSGPTLQESQ